jgi:methionine-gamma-lyase
MVTITVAGDPGRGRRLLGELCLIAHATSLGGVESIACLPVATSHAAVAEAERLRQGIEENTVRLSLGIEDADDLVADLEGALQRSARAVSA